MARYDGPGGGRDAAQALALDGAGNVYVTGESDSDTLRDYNDIDYATVKYVQAPIGSEFIRGDVDGNGNLELLDAITVLQFVFLTPRPAIACLDAADADDTGNLDQFDGVQILQRVFVDSTVPIPAPFPDCGSDSTPDDLGCESFADCQ